MQSRFQLLRAGAECKSDDTLLARPPTKSWRAAHADAATGGGDSSMEHHATFMRAAAQRCAAACHDNARAGGGCRFFIVGQESAQTDWEAGICRMEHTKTKACAEGFEPDVFNFYELLGTVPIGAEDVQPSSRAPTP